MAIGDILERRAILPRVHAGSKRHVMGVIADAAHRLYGLSAAEVAEALLRREQLSSTGIGLGVALPHARLDGLARTRGLFARLEAPVAFAAIDDQPVDLVFALLAPAGQAADDLRALSCVARVLRQPELRRQLRAAPTQDGIHALLVSEVRSSAA